MKPLTLEETRLKEEMKEKCLAKGQYIDEKAKEKFYMLCHLEDFEVQYWELLKENQSLKKQLEEYKATNKVLSQELTKDKVLQQDHLTTCCGIPIGDIPKLITQQK